MYEKLKRKERSQHLEESEEIRLHQEHSFRKTENAGVRKGAGEQEGAGGASVTAPSGSAGGELGTDRRPALPTGRRGARLGERGDSHTGRQGEGKRLAHRTGRATHFPRAARGSPARSPRVCGVGTRALRRRRSPC